MPTTAKYINAKIVRGRDGKYFVAAADSSEPLIPILFPTEAKAREFIEKLNRRAETEPWRQN